MKKKKIYADLGAITKEEKNFFLYSASWPVNEKTFWQFIDFIFENYYSSLKGLKGKEYYIGMIEVSFLNFLIQVLHYNFIKEYTKNNQIKLMHTKFSSRFLKPNWNNAANYYKFHSFPYNKFQRILRKYIKAILFNRHLSIYRLILGIFSKKKYISLGSFDNIKKDYISKTNNFYYHYDWVDLLDKNIKFKKNDAEIIALVKSLSEQTIHPLLLNLQKSKFTKEFVKGLDLKKVQKVWETRLVDIYSLHRSFKPLKHAKELLITECGNSFHKIIASIFKEKKVSVINFSHGNDPGFLDQRWTHNWLISICSHYAFESLGIKNSFHKIRKNFMLDFKEKINYLNVNSPTYRRIKVSKKLVHSKNSIMILGYPMNSKRYVDDVYHFFHYKLKLELHLINELKKTSRNIIYKAHPDRIQELGSIFKNEQIQVVTDKFEKVWHKAEALIFSYVTTSTFGFAIHLPVPIILINLKSTKWIEERKNLLEQRVAFISNCDGDSFNNLNIENIEKALRIAKERVNLDIAKKIIE